MNEIAIKTERLCKMLAAENLGGVLINAQHNFAWLTGGRSNGINGSVESGACFLFVRADGKRFVLANNIELTRIVTEEISAEDFEPVEFSWEEEKFSGNFIYEKARSLLIESREIVSDLYLNPKIRAVENTIAPLRFSLTEPEIERYRRLGKDAGKALGDIFAELENGATEIEIARKARDAFAAFNINSIVTLVGADERIEKFRHPVPTNNVWRKTLLIGVCARREGLIANLSRLACVGAIPDELHRKTEAVARVYAKITVATETGKSGAELYQILADAYAAEDFADEIKKHHQGGATGYKTRDWTAHPTSKDTVQENQAFAWNPTITGTKTEETFITRDDGAAEMLTSSPNFPEISVKVNGKEFVSSGILSL